MVPATSSSRAPISIDWAKAALLGLSPRIRIQHTSASEFGQILVNSCFTFSLLVGISVHDTTLDVLVANLGFESTTFPSPVFVGDTVTAEAEVIDARADKPITPKVVCASASP